ncbi:IS1249 family transposase [Bifidobacterium sp. ESL0728]|uniref:IS1249 family transposase n=1 Tax=Bifidobacterium sp. ESL0728 TaxID=2983220 RepID=UPI0023F82432|nr:IS1249 family transposase [Bifidobacterium sp. ESL0728]WEV59033.1 IS1249 family transposase [Bifidobacterium sp. ESL0728]
MARRRSPRARLCPLCGLPMRRNGYTKAGRQRWRCDACSASGVATRPDATRLAEFRAWLSWVLGRTDVLQAARAIGVATRQGFAKRTSWCWRVRPRLPKPGKAHCVEVDGTYLNGWCLLVAVDAEDGRPLAFQWCDTEKKAAWLALFRRIPRPDVVVCDGGAGCLAAIGRAWPGMRVQRCLVHVLRNTRRDLTSRPRTEPGKALYKLARRLVNVKRCGTPEQAGQWLADLQEWYEENKEWLDERTAARDPDTGFRRTWYTHQRARDAYHRLARLNAAGMLFTWLDPELDAGGPVAWNTNMLEGGTNKPVKDAMRRHSGLSPEHARRICEWLLYMRTRDPEPERFATPEHWQGKTRKQQADSTLALPGLDRRSVQQADPDDPAVDPYESGFGIRHGWAGQSH